MTPTPQQQWAARLNEILYALGGHSTQNPDIIKAKAAINKAVAEIVIGPTEMPPYTTPIIARNDLRAEQRLIIGGDK